MMSNELIIVAYYPLFLMIVGTLLNLLTLFVLCRSTFKQTNKQPTIYYMRAIAVFDILILYGWNLNHYLSAVHGFSLLDHTVLSCKLDLYFGYSISQISAWLRVLVCLDRYFLLSCLHRTWFNKPRHVLILITGVIVFFALFNLHLPVFNCFETSNSTVNIGATLYSTYPTWNYIQIIVCDCLPFLFMMIFNISIIYHLLYLRQTTAARKSRSRNVSISITLLITTFLFLIMTIPGDTVYTFFYDPSRSTVLQIADATMFTYHITSFPLYMVTLKDFRRVFISMMTWKTIDPKLVATISKDRTNMYLTVKMANENRFSNTSSRIY